MKMVPVVFDHREVRLPAGEVVPVMIPQPRYVKIVRRQFVVGEAYPLVILEARSRASHNQFFAAVHDGFSNLPENHAAIARRLNLKNPIPPDGWLDPEHLRKWCLCETGFCEVHEFDFGSPKEAANMARFYRSRDNYAIITVRGQHVTIKIPLSQSAAAMAKAQFEESKRAVLDLIESMIGLGRGKLNKEAGRSA